ncbi:DUF4391 domain-containing protein [Pseudomonas synxantha]|uniref:DUF4391 domain-containing protein n=1 Tax=Pseudomonas synxantha TaxID=47883 RepID=UPI00099CA933|nr:DUF4391 domain-containing protein [Pseudomonas synxantha]OPB00301.1 methyl-accepting chemotaxis protein [Pseudomonas synxantha]
MSHISPWESNAAFISYPKQATFGRNLPKNKIYEHSGANTRLKDLFVEQVEQVVWQYKLAPETINLPARPNVPELQIFAIQLKTLELNLDVLRCIDGAVQFPIIFELSFDGRTQVVAAFKRPNESDASRWVLSDYFATAWVPSDVERAVMPLALDLGGLYEQLLHRLIPTPARQKEGLGDLVARVELVSAKQSEVEKVASKLAKEKQFNRKVEINALLRQLRNELEQLTGRESP